MEKRKALSSRGCRIQSGIVSRPLYHQLHQPPTTNPSIQLWFTHQYQIASLIPLIRQPLHIHLPIWVSLNPSICKCTFLLDNVCFAIYSLTKSPASLSPRKKSPQRTKPRTSKRGRIETQNSFNIYDWTGFIAGRRPLSHASLYTENTNAILNLRSRFKTTFWIL